MLCMLCISERVDCGIDDRIDAGIGERIDVGIAEIFYCVIGERIDVCMLYVIYVMYVMYVMYQWEGHCQIGDRIDAGIGERIDVWTGDIIDGGIAERIDGGISERINGVIGERIDVPYGRKFWREIYFGGLAVLRAIHQYFIRQKLHSVMSSLLQNHSLCTRLQLDAPV